MVGVDVDDDDVLLLLLDGFIVGVEDDLLVGVEDPFGLRFGLERDDIFN